MNWIVKFDRPLYQARIKENARVGEDVCQVTAHENVDADYTEENYNIYHARLEYSLASNIFNPLPFAIDKFDGKIKVNGALDFELESVYIIDVLVKDISYHVEDKAKINITLINVIDQAPLFEQDHYEFRVIPNQSYVGQVKAIDMENTGNMSYSIRLGTTNDTNLFCIMQNGEIHFCSRPTTVSSGASTASKNSPTSFNYRAPQIPAKKSNFYLINVIASIYSKDEFKMLESSVECRIMLEDNHNKQQPASYYYQYASGSSLTTARTKAPKRLNSNNFTSSSTFFTLFPSLSKRANSSSFKSIILAPSSTDQRPFLNDTTLAYAFVLVVLGTVALVVLIVSLLIWIKCQRQTKSNNENKLRTKRMQAKALPLNQTCSSSSSASERSKNLKKHNKSSLASSVDLLRNSSHLEHARSIKSSNTSEDDTRELTNITSQTEFPTKWKETRGENGIIYNQSRCSSIVGEKSQVNVNVEDGEVHASREGVSGGDGSPISKITILSDYIDLNQSLPNTHHVSKVNIGSKSRNVEHSRQAHVSKFSSKDKTTNDKPKAIDEGKEPPITISLYSDVVSSNASTLKNRHTPIVVRQELDDARNSSSIYEYFNNADAINNSNNYNNNNSSMFSKNDTIDANKSSCIKIIINQTNKDAGGRLPTRDQFKSSPYSISSSPLSTSLSMSASSACIENEPNINALNTKHSSSNSNSTRQLINYSHNAANNKIQPKEGVSVGIGPCGFSPNANRQVKFPNKTRSSKQSDGQYLNKIPIQKHSRALLGKIIKILLM
jgi:hypothetical protein